MNSKYKLHTSYTMVYVVQKGPYAFSAVLVWNRVLNKKRIIDFYHFDLKRGENLGVRYKKVCEKCN